MIQSVKIYFELNMLQDHLYKSRAQVLSWMFHHSGVSKPELSTGLGKQKMTPCRCWWISHWKDHSWHNINQVWSFLLFIISFLGCYNLSWSQASHILSPDLLPSGRCSASGQQTPAFNTIRSQKIIFEAGKSRTVATITLPCDYRESRSNLKR